MTITLHWEFHHGLIYPVSLELVTGAISSARLQNTVTRVLPPLLLLAAAPAPAVLVLDDADHLHDELIDGLHQLVAHAAAQLLLEDIRTELYNIKGIQVFI